MITTFAENVGAFLFVGLCMILSGKLAYFLNALIVSEAKKGEVVDYADALIAIGKLVLCWVQHMKATWLATVCTVAIFLILWGSTEASIQASFGFASIAYAIGGVLTPRFIQQLNAVVETPQVLPEDASE
jgi:hypothetical protein